MHSPLILMFFLSSIFTQNILSLEYFGGDSLYVKSVTESPIAGFQFELDNIAITNVNMPDSISTGFNISYTDTTILVFSFNGATIPSGTNILSVVYFDTLSVYGNICFDDECFQNTNDDGGSFYNCILSNSSGGGLYLENYTTDLDYCAEGCFEETACNYLTIDSCEYPETNFDCFGNCISETDECGVCGGDDSSCADCAGTPNGDVVDDECGVCGGNNSTCTDCFNAVNPCGDGTNDCDNWAYIDGCEECIGGTTGLDACPQDCNGVDGGSAFFDNCSECVAAGDTSCVEGCDGNYENDGSHVVDDECGVCGGGDSSCADCAGVANGDSFTDNCSECVAAGDTSCVEGCDGNYENDGSHVVDDECGVCGGNNLSCFGCDGILNSGVVEDACGNCGGDCILDPFINKIVCTSQSNNQYNQIIANCLGECGGDECLSIEDNMPYSVSIRSTYPNPFNPSINIEYSVASVGPIILQIIGLDGRHINTITNSVQIQGLYNVQWTPDNIPSGMYLIQLKANDQVQNKKIIYLK